MTTLKSKHRIGYQTPDTSKYYKNSSKAVVGVFVIIARRQTQNLPRDYITAHTDCVSLISAYIL